MTRPKADPQAEVVVDTGAFPDQTAPADDACPYPGCVLKKHAGDHKFDEADAAIAEAERIASDAAESNQGAPASLEGQKLRRTRRRKPPMELGEALVVIPVTLTNIAVSHPIANITVSLKFKTDRLIDARPIGGMQTFALVFGKSFIGTGYILAGAPMTWDNQRDGHQTFDVKMPRFAEGIDQVAEYIAPLVSEPLSILGLLALNESFTINITASQEGSLAFHLASEQTSLDLTGRAADDGTNESVES